MPPRAVLGRCNRWMEPLVETWCARQSATLGSLGTLCRGPGLGLPPVLLRAVLLNSLTPLATVEVQVGVAVEWAGSRSVTIVSPMSQFDERTILMPLTTVLPLVARGPLRLLVHCGLHCMVALVWLRLLGAPSSCHGCCLSWLVSGHCSCCMLECADAALSGTAIGLDPPWLADCTEQDL